MLFVVAEILHVVAVALFVLLLYALQVLLLQPLAIEQMQKINFTLVGENFEKLKTLHILSIFYLTYDDNYIYKLLFLNINNFLTCIHYSIHNLGFDDLFFSGV